MDCRRLYKTFVASFLDGLCLESVDKVCDKGNQTCHGSSRRPDFLRTFSTIDEE